MWETGSVTQQIIFIVLTFIAAEVGSKNYWIMGCTLFVLCTFSRSCIYLATVFLTLNCPVLSFISWFLMLSFVYFQKLTHALAWASIVNVIAVLRL